MTVNEIANKLNATVHFDGGKDFDGFYLGDFLSRVMGKAPSGCCWITVMNNVNVAGVASLADIKAVVLCEGVLPDARLLEKCTDEGISLLTTELSAFNAAVKLG